ncbi:hypothetical protein BH09BAC1_BH09BAC1_07320 [soil metagenome]
MDINQKAKEAVLALVVEKQKDISRLTISKSYKGHGDLKKINTVLIDIRKLTTENNLDMNVYYNSCSMAFDELMKNKRFEDASKLAKAQDGNLNSESLPEEADIESSLVLSILLTCFAGFIFLIVLMANQIKWYWCIGLTALFMLIYPFFGKYIYTANDFLLSGIDKLFNFENDNSLSLAFKANKLVWIALWPFGILITFILLLVMVIGNVYKSIK